LAGNCELEAGKLQAVAVNSPAHNNPENGLEKVWGREVLPDIDSIAEADLLDPEIYYDLNSANIKWSQADTTNVVIVNAIPNKTTEAVEGYDDRVENLEWDSFMEYINM